MKLHERPHRKTQVTAALLACLALPAAVAFAQDSPPQVTPTNATWESPVAAELELRVSGPGGLFWSRVFAPAEIVEVATQDLVTALSESSERSAPDSLRPRADSATGRLGSAPHEPRTLQDGMYNWELRERSDRGGSGIWRGRLQMEDGRFLTDPADAPLHRAASADHVIADDLIADRACFGPNCVDGELFGSEQLKLSAPQPGLLFDSTGFDWRIDTEKTPGQFSLSRLSSTGSPFDRLSIDTGPGFNSSLFLGANGAGLNTSAPAGTLHVLDPLGSPASLILEASFGPRWEMLTTAVDGGLWIRRAVTEPINIMLSGNTDTRIVLGQGSRGLFEFDNSSEVLLRSGFPATRLRVSGASSSDTYASFGFVDHTLNVGSAGATFGRGSGFLNIRPDAAAVAPNPSIRFMIANQPAMILDNEGYLGLSSTRNFDPANPIELESGAHVTVGGVWTNASSRALKTDIEPLPTATAVATLEALEPVRFRYEAEPDETYLGFIAEDVPEAVAHSDRKSLSPMDLVAVLTEVVQQQTKALKRQEQRLDDQARELVRIRHQLADLVRQRHEALGSAQNELPANKSEVSER